MVGLDDNERKIMLDAAKNDANKISMKEAPL